MNSRPETFCALAWTHMYTSPSGRVALCCIAREHIRESAERELNLQTHSFQEIWNSQQYRDLRRRMYAGERLAACKVCYQNEENRIPSYRQWANDYWLSQHARAEALEAAIDRSADRDFHAERPVSFDLRLGNLCNAIVLSARAVSPSRVPPTV